MNKPRKKRSEPIYLYNDVIKYIEEKYKIKTRGYKEDIDGLYRDFWHWIGSHNDVFREGCSVRLIPEDSNIDLNVVIKESDYLHKEDCNRESTWVTEILQLILKEFPQLDEESLWVSW